jgi:spore coat polysaccharide biosynthesis protein SpsF
VKTVAIIQARMTSTRLPGKIMAEVAGKPLLYHVVNRARRAQTPDLVAIATTDRPTDDGVEEFSQAAGIPVFRGSEQDVLDRYYGAAQQFAAEVIVRLTSDCPLLDPAVIDKTVRAFQAGAYDYASNTLEPTFPDGLDTEVFSQAALEKAWREARLPSEREHVTSYIWKRPALFRLRSVKNEEDLSHLRWTVDEAEDLEFVRRVYTALGAGSAFGMAEVLALLQEDLELSDINARFGRNEGYQKSLLADAASANRQTGEEP